MKKHYALLSFLSIIFVFIIFSCSNDEEYTAVSAVTVDLTQVPYPKLSDYKFFTGVMKNQLPSADVLPFQPASALFTDYAHKKRFVWMPSGLKATYNSDKTVLELPIGAALIKTFYYDNVQNVTPVGATRLIETRVMIRKSSGWIFADYVWNAEQTEAFLDLAGSFTTVTWKDENNVIKTADYRVPSEVQCIVCHKIRQYDHDNVEILPIHIPLGIKPQNLNWDYNYGGNIKNQLTKWVEEGYLQGNFALPSEENTTVDYSDASKPLEVRVRSYVDANCSHCHADERHCDYRPMRFAFSETGGATGQTKLGVCVNTSDMQDFPVTLDKIVAPGDVNRSMMYYRLNTTNEAYRMPLHGRTIIHEEGIALIGQWINSLHNCP